LLLTILLSKNWEKILLRIIVTMTQMEKVISIYIMNDYRIIPIYANSVIYNLDRVFVMNRKKKLIDFLFSILYIATILPILMYQRNRFAIKKILFLLNLPYIFAHWSGMCIIIIFSTQ
jgi:hypothetical protein